MALWAPRLSRCRYWNQILPCEIGTGSSQYAHFPAERPAIVCGMLQIEIDVPDALPPKKTTDRVLPSQRRVEADGSGQRHDTPADTDQPVAVE